MVRRVYIIPLSGSQEAAQLNSERIRVGNIFDTTRQGVILTRNSEAAVMRTTMHDGIDTFAKLDSSSYQRNQLSTEGINRSYRAKTAAYTIVGTDYLIDCTSGTFAVTLPTAVSIPGREYIIHNSGSGIITINTTSSQTIDGVASGVMTLIQYDNLKVMSDGANWIKIN